VFNTVWKLCCRNGNRHLTIPTTIREHLDLTKLTCSCLIVAHDLLVVWEWGLSFWPWLVLPLLALYYLQLINEMVGGGVSVTILLFVVLCCVPGYSISYFANFDNYFCVSLHVCILLLEGVGPPFFIEKLSLDVPRCPLEKTTSLIRYP